MLQLHRAVQLGLVLACLLAVSPPAPGQADEFRTWREYGGGPSHAKYSSLDQVNRDNVHRLQLAWTYDAGDLDSEERGYHARRRLQHTPLVLGDRLYGVSPSLRVFALDAANGELVWEHGPDLAPGQESEGGVFIRGLMQWRGERILYTAGHTLRALDAETGEPVRGFGRNGSVDLREGLGRPPESLRISATSPGVVFEDLVILGSSVPESLPSTPGDVRAWNVHTGELAWSFHTIPHPGEYGHDSWPREAWRYAGGANSWSGISLDRERGMVFFATGSASDDFYGANRHGDNLFANSVVALDARTGERRWHFQVVRHDAWDRDLPAPPVLVTVTRDGRAVDAVAQITKSGHVYLLDRESGESLFPLREVATAPSQLPGEQLSSTQVLPELPAPFTRQPWDASTVTDRTPEAAASVLEQLESLSTGGQFIPPSTRGQVLFPGFDGGGEWGGPAFDPETRLLYVNANEVASLLTMVEKQPLPAGAKASDVYGLLCAGCHGADRAGSGEFPPLHDLAGRHDYHSMVAIVRDGRGRMPGFGAWLDWQGQGALANWLLWDKDESVNNAFGDDSPLFMRYRIDGYPPFVDYEGYPANSPPWGTLSAIDLDSGETAWQVPLGEYPELVANGQAGTGSQNYGGPVVTAGGLVFIAATLHDRRIRAFDKASGEVLWQYELPAAGVATPAIYESGGRQFIVITAGGHKFGGPQTGKYLAFALPESAPAP